MSNQSYDKKTNLVSSDQGVEVVVKGLIQELINNGATISDSIELSSLSNQLSINLVNQSQIKSSLLIVPLKCMPLLSDFEFSTSDFVLKASMKSCVINPSAETVMSLMVKLFNQTNKLHSWRGSFAFFTLSNQKPLLQALLAFRPQGQKINGYWQLLNEGKVEKLLIDSFLGSREFTYKKGALASAGIQTPNVSEKGLLAVIDFFNHKMGDSSYVINRQTGCMEIYANEVDENGEVFVQYGFIDALQAYLTYGFVDTASPIYFSGRMQFKLKSGLNFVVLGMAGGLQRTVPLPNEQTHLTNYLPPGIKRDGDNIVISELVIPSGDKVSYLKESLAIILKQCDISGAYKSKRMFSEEVEHIERQVLMLNISFWQQYETMVDKSIKTDRKFNKTTEDDLRTLIKFNIDFCKMYAKEMGYSL